MQAVGIGVGEDDDLAVAQTRDMLLAKKRAGDRREWLETKGNLAQIVV